MNICWRSTVLLSPIHTEIGTNERGGIKEQNLYRRSALTPWRVHVDNNMFHGCDFDTTMFAYRRHEPDYARVEAPDIHYQGHHEPELQR